MATTTRVSCGRPSRSRLFKSALSNMASRPLNRALGLELFFCRPQYRGAFARLPQPKRLQSAVLAGRQQVMPPSGLLACAWAMAKPLEKNDFPSEGQWPADCKPMSRRIDLAKEVARVECRDGNQCRA